MSSRKHYTSCDPCRKSRLGCDAVTKRLGRCSNCIRREKSCTFDWVEQRRNGRNSGNTPRQRSSDVALKDISEGAAGHKRQTSQISSTNLAFHEWEFASTRRQYALQLHHILWDIFTDLFEPQLGIWIGNDCNPFKIIDTAPKTLISRLMFTLDSYQQTPPSSAVIRNLGLPAGAPGFGLGREESTVIDQALMSAVHAFAARWLPLEHFKSSDTVTTKELQDTKATFLESIWKRAQGDVSRVMTTPSYRSILALYLFGITPTSSNNKERQFSDLCLEIHLRHYITLRSISRISPPKKWHDLGDGSYNPSLQFKESLDRDALEHTHLEDTAFWFGIVCDTSRCLTKCQSSILLPGLTGDSKVWDIVRRQVEEFDGMYRHLHTSRSVLSDDVVFKIIQHGSACKTLCWATISHVQDAMVHHMTGLSIEKAIEKAITELNRFEDVFAPLLDHIARDYLLLGEKSRVSYFLLTLHYHLGVLILVDTVDTMQDGSMNMGLRLNTIDYRLTSTRAMINLINLSLQTDAHGNESFSNRLLRDPYPEHVSNGLSRAAYSIIYLFRSKMLNAEAANVMASAVLSGLETLSLVAYSAAESLTTLRELFPEARLNVTSINANIPAEIVHNTAALPNSPVYLKLFEDDVIKELGQQVTADPSLIIKTIERHEPIDRREVNDNPADFELEDLQWIDFNAMEQEWAFEDCFTSL